MVRIKATVVDIGDRGRGIVSITKQEEGSGIDIQAYVAEPSYCARELKGRR